MKRKKKTNNTSSLAPVNKSDHECNLNMSILNFLYINRFKLKVILVWSQQHLNSNTQKNWTTTLPQNSLKMSRFYGIMCKFHFTLPEIKAASWIIKWFYMIIKVRSQIAKKQITYIRHFFIYCISFTSIIES